MFHAILFLFQDLGRIVFDGAPRFVPGKFEFEASLEIIEVKHLMFFGFFLFTHQQSTTNACPNHNLIDVISFWWLPARC